MNVKLHKGEEKMSATFSVVGFENVSERSFVSTKIHKKGVVVVMKKGDLFQSASFLGDTNKPSWIGVRSKDAAVVRTAVEKDFAAKDSGRRWYGEWTAQVAERWDVMEGDYMIDSLPTKADAERVAADVRRRGSPTARAVERANQADFDARTI